MGNRSEHSEFQSSLSKTNDIILGVVYSLFGVCSVTGNSMLLLVAYRKRSLLKPAEFFIVSLAISDLAMTGTMLPLAIPSLFAHRWLFGSFFCQYYAFCGVLFGLSSLTNHTVLSSVCCMKVCYPTYGNRFSSSHCRILLLCVWAYAFVFATAPLADWGRYGAEPHGTACCIDWRAANHEHKATAYIISLFVLCYMIPCALILVSYTLILLTVRESQQAVQQHLSPRTKGISVHSLIVKLSVAVCVGFLLAWTPYAIVAMWTAFTDANEVPSLVFALAAAFAKSSTLYNPMVCLLLKPSFLKVLTKDLSVCRTKCLGACQGRRNPRKSINGLPKKVTTSTQFTVTFKESRGSCRSCADTFECFSKYPKCCNIGHNGDTQPGAKNPIGTIVSQSVVGRTVHLTVYASNTTYGADTIEIPSGALPPHFVKDFI
ncbi:opsin-5-like [Discoglossus pictus]